MTPGQCRAARSWLKWSVRHTAKMAGVSKNSVVRFEGGENVMHRTVLNLKHAFEKSGIEFEGNIGVFLREP